MIEPETEQSVTQAEVAELLHCSPYRAHDLISRRVLRPIAKTEDGRPLYSSVDVWDLYRGTMRGRELVFGPHPRDRA